MKFIDYFNPKNYSFNDKNTSEIKSSSISQFDGYSYGVSYPIVNKVWDGEKTLGELGAVVRNIPDFDRLRLRSYDAYATKDIVGIIATKHFYWTIGSGLKLQSEPNRTVLESEGISGVDFAKFQKMVEARFMVYANSKKCDFLNEKNLHECALDFFKGTFLGGDTLCIIRYSEAGPNSQFISGEHIRNPEIGSKWYDEAEKLKHTIEHGIETDQTGKHIAYFVNTKPNSKDLITTYERIPAYGVKSGNRLAWIISGKKISPDHKRSVPAISQSLENINKLDRYTGGAVGKAEQAANVANFIEHNSDSTGESPFEKNINKKRGILDNGNYDNEALADGLANRITEATSNQTINLTPGSTIKSFETSIETKFQEFHNAQFSIISAGQDIPAEVALQQYNSNYSASRAAINSFGYIISIKRQDFANQFYIPFYKLWLEWQILTNKINAPMYVENIDNFMVTESYSQCRFIGKNMPHIDPLKEIKAVREMLGVDDTTALISREQATEMLNAGQWDENFMKSLEEANIIPKPIVEQSNNTNNNSDATKK